MHASEWCKHSSVTFNFIDDDNDDHGDNSGDKLDILVSFAPSYGPWSITGNHSAALARAGKPSMNLSWITPAKNPADVRHAVLHQFGHALGAPHHLPGPRALTLDTAKIARDLEPRPAAGGGGDVPRSEAATAIPPGTSALRTGARERHDTVLPARLDGRRQATPAPDPAPLRARPVMDRRVLPAPFLSRPTVHIRLGLGTRPQDLGPQALPRRLRL